MTELTIADSGILVAFLNKREQWHGWTLEQMNKLSPPFVTCEAVVTECCFLMKGESNGEQDVLGLISDELLKVDFSLQSEVAEIQTLMKKYENVPMSLADACLVRMSEFTKRAKIFTLDSDFWIYRRNGNEEIPLIIPPNRQK